MSNGCKIFGMNPAFDLLGYMPIRIMTYLSKPLTFDKGFNIVIRPKEPNAEIQLTITHIINRQIKLPAVIFSLPPPDAFRSGQHIDVIITPFYDLSSVYIIFISMTGIYKIINKVNGKYYVGSSIELDKPHGRWYKHKRALMKRKHINSHLQSAWNKYGENNFDFLIIENVSEDKLIETEQKYLDKASNEKDQCYNQNFLAERGSFSEEIVKKRVKSIRKFYETHPNPMTGKIHSEESKEKMRQKAIGRKLSNETKQKLKGYTPANIDPNQYQFISSSETFIGIRRDFRKLHPEIPPANISWSIKHNKPTRGWNIRLKP